MPTGPGAGEGQQASGIEPAAVGGKGEGIFWGAFLWSPQTQQDLGWPNVWGTLGLSSFQEEETPGVV